MFIYVITIVGTCFCNLKKLSATQQRLNEKKAGMQLITYLELDQIQPPASKVKIGLISRRRKRFILNEYELVDSIQKLGFECELLPLETMTIFEQLYAFRTLDVLIGIHGSALDNRLVY